MFGVDVFNHGQIYTFKGDRYDHDTWYGGDKVKLMMYCIDDSNPDAEFLVAETNQETALLDLNGLESATFTPDILPSISSRGTSSLHALYVPVNYRVIVTTTESNTITINGPEQIACLAFMDEWDTGGENLQSLEVIDTAYTSSNCQNDKRYIKEDGTCGGCVGGYHENDDGECVECSHWNQKQNKDGSCGNCLSGYFVDEDTESNTYNQCIREEADDRTLLYAGVGVVILVVLIALVK